MLQIYLIFLFMFSTTLCYGYYTSYTIAYDIMIFVYCRLRDIMNPVFGRLSIGWQLLFHFIIFAVFAYDITYHDYYFNVPGGRGYGGKWKYLTIWDVVSLCKYCGSH